MEQITILRTQNLDEPNFKRKVTNYFWSELLDDNHIPIPQCKLNHGFKHDMSAMNLITFLWILLRLSRVV